MTTQVLDLLQYLFERFQDHAVVTIEKNQDLVDELMQVGFSHREIDVALHWIDGLVETCSNELAPLTEGQQNRIYHPFEKQTLSIKCQGFLHFLEQIRVLDNHSREAVIDRAVAINAGQNIELGQLKWIVGMVLLNIPGKEDAAILLENIGARIH